MIQIWKCLKVCSQLAYSTLDFKDSVISKKIKNLDANLSQSEAYDTKQLNSLLNRYQDKIKSIRKAAGIFLKGFQRGIYRYKSWGWLVSAQGIFSWGWNIALWIGVNFSRINCTFILQKKNSRIHFRT